MSVHVLTEHGQLDTLELADGLILRLSGAIDDDCVGALRTALFSAVVGDRRDVVVDAGAVTAISADAIAVLLAAPEWIDYQGGRFLLSASSVAFDAELASRGLGETLRRLDTHRPAAPDDVVTIPAQRISLD